MWAGGRWPCLVQFQMFPQFQTTCPPARTPPTSLLHRHSLPVLAGCTPSPRLSSPGPPPSSLPFHSGVPQALVSPVMLSLLWRLWLGGMREASKSVFLSQKQKTEQNNAHCLGPISSVQESPEVWRTGRAGGTLRWVMGYGIMVGHREPRAVPRLSSHCR